MGELVTGRLGEGIYENSLHLLLNFAGTLKLLKKKKKKVCLKKTKSDPPARKTQCAAGQAPRARPVPREN